MMVNVIFNFLMGLIVKVIVVVVFVIVGYMFFVGNGNKGMFVFIIIGCFIIFGVGWFVDMIFGI